MHYSRNPLWKIKSSGTHRKNLNLIKIALSVELSGVWSVLADVAQAQSTNTPFMGLGWGLGGRIHGPKIS